MKLVLLLFSAVLLAAQSPRTTRWREFISAHAGHYRLPSDEKIGQLADIRGKDSSSWASVFAVCDTVFTAVREGRIPTEAFYAATRLPLTVAFTAVVEAGPREENHRYGEPVREENRITIPVRVSGGQSIGYGFVYLIHTGENWLVEQWTVDLSGLPIGALSENAIQQENSSADKVMRQ